MKEVSHLLRKAYLDLVAPLVVEGVTIPFFDERVNPSVTIPTYRGGNAYILILDQTEQETTINRCNLRKSCSITLDVVTKYPLNVGTRLASELISNELQEQIRILLDQPLGISGFQVLSTRLEFSRNFIEDGATQTAYRKQLAFTHSIYEL